MFKFLFTFLVNDHRVGRNVKNEINMIFSAAIVLTFVMELLPLHKQNVHFYYHGLSHSADQIEQAETSSWESHNDWQTTLMSFFNYH